MIRPADYDGVYSREREKTILGTLDSRVSGHALIARFGCVGYLNSQELRAIQRTLVATAQALPGRQVLLDLGCGVSLFGCWMAQQLRFDLIGLDFSEVAVRVLVKKSKTLMPAGARFVQASFEATGLPARSVAAVMSLDALYLVANPRSALEELRRVTTPGAPLVYSYYSSPRDRADWPRLTRQAGFDRVRILDSTVDWRKYMFRKHSRRWRNRAAIRRQLGSWAEAELAVTKAMLGLDSAVPSVLSETSRHVVLAVRK